ncbi:MAG: OmpA family protein [Muribaculaceae bacterium]|nr:OmpA family protein [Muribaculaceae bacterium]
MKKLWISLTISLAAISAFGAKPNENARIPELDNLSNEELIMSVPLGKQADLVSKFQEQEALRLHKGDYKPSTGCNIETYRDKQVIIITVPAANLFAPNDTELSDDAARYLDPLQRYLKKTAPDMYRVLLVMHTDDTGSTAYTDNLSLERVESVYEYLEDAGVDTRYLFPTAAGATDPLHENNTVEGRAANRRLEIYLIPGTRMQDEAKKGRIAF